MFCLKKMYLFCIFNYTKIKLHPLSYMYKDLKNNTPKDVHNSDNYKLTSLIYEKI